MYLLHLWMLDSHVEMLGLLPPAETVQTIPQLKTAKKPATAVLVITAHKPSAIPFLSLTLHNHYRHSNELTKNLG